MERVMNEKTIYRAALYCRLSKDDEQAGESVSIETQKMMLTDFCHERGFPIYEIYADDGYSGLNFNRPAFTRLLEDIDNGKINLVITKNCSDLTDHAGNVFILNRNNVCSRLEINLISVKINKSYLRFCKYSA